MGRKVVRLYVAVGLLLVADRAGAQGIAQSFDELRLLVRPGETIRVLQDDTTSVKGTFVGARPEQLTLRVGSKDLEVTPAHVREIRKRRQDSLSNGARIGLAVGAGFGALGALMCDGCTATVSIPFALIYGGIGAGIGTGLDALVQEDAVIYASPARRAASRMRIGPLVDARRRGVGVAFAF
ncbi:MAG: hypothetical protein JSU08_02710 [Acidobacteria bacterium]|nr:hypothetical protein [Acidobacteriota bacterium]